MSVVGETVWLVAVMEEPAEPVPGRSVIPSHRLYGSRDSASEGLRDMFEETVGIDDMPPEAVTQTQYEEDIGTYHGSFTIDGKRVSFIVTPLEVRE